MRKLKARSTETRSQSESGRNLAAVFRFRGWLLVSALLRFAGLAVVFFLAAPQAQAAAWSDLLDPTRAVDWSKAGFTIPNYTTPCATQPTLLPGQSNAAANTTAIQNALASCDSTHNVVNLPAGTYYTNGWVYDGVNHAVVRGAGGSSTYIYLKAEACGGTQASGVCIESSDNTYDGSSSVISPGGAHQCSWTGGLAQGSTSLTLSNCGSAPPNNNILILDQANDASDTGGVYHCDGNQVGCNYEGGLNGNGRTVSGTQHSQSQITFITGVTSLGGGSYTVTISPGVYFNNIRSGQSPGAWWFTNAVNIGLENLTLDGTSIADHNINFYNCYQCWVKNIRSINAPKDHIFLGQSNSCVIRDSYFYQGQSHGSESYAIEFEIGSADLVENNIFQQNTNPLMFGAGTGNAVLYNFEIDNVTTNLYSLQTSYYSHNTANSMNLWEGNNFIGAWTDDAWGSSSLGTLYRNMFHGWQGGGYSTGFVPVMVRTWIRGFNAIGNVLGHPSTQNQYQAYATSSTAGSGGTNAGTSIYEIGWADIGGYGTCGNGTSGSPYCDPLAFSTFMRWGNYDTVNAAVSWNSTEASPRAATYLNANFTSSYFNSLAHTLPASLYYNSKPSWWPSGKAWPAIGPDVSSGNLGTCSGTYNGAQATASGQCMGGTLTAAWAAHATSIPAQDCYLNTMGGPPDGSGSVLSFDAANCYGTSSGSTNNPPTVATAASAAPSPVTGTTTSLSVLGADAAGESNLTYTWSTTGTPPASVSFSTNTSNAAKNTTATFTKAGSYSFQVVIVDTSSLFVPSSVNVTVNQTVSSVTISASAIVQVNGTHQFTANAWDQFNQPMAVAPSFNWLVSGGGTISPSGGLFTAGNTAGGPFNVTVTANGITSAASQVTVSVTNLLPAIDPNNLPSYAGLNDSLSINNYPDSNVSFFWSFGPSTTNPYGALSVMAKASGASFQTSGAKTAALASYGLSLGTYQVTVYAQDSSGNKSPTLTGTVTLVNADFSAMRVYPNPWRSDKHAGKQIIFDRLPLGATVKLFTVSGHLVKTLTPNIDTAMWDLTNDSGGKVGSGIYLYLITTGDTGYGGNGQKVRGKLAVVK